MIIVPSKETRPMVWSNWRGAVLLMLAWVGPAWSQGTVPTPSTSEKIMTVHDNGKSQRCKIITSWRTPEGSKAYQLQVIASGEMITIVEDGPATTLQEGKVKSLQMRIFHWGRDHDTPPLGVPTAPGESVVTNSASSNKTLSTSTPPTKKMVVTNASIPVVTPGKDQVIWWEEKNGQRVSPIITTSGKNPFEQSSPIILPSANAAKELANKANDSSKWDSPRGQAIADSKIITTSPATTTITTSPVSPLVVLPTPSEATRMGTNSPTIRPVVQVNPPSSPTPSPYVQTGPTMLPNKTSPTQVAQANTPYPQIASTTPMTPAQSNSSNAAVPTTASAATNTKPETPAPAAKTTFLQKVGNFFHPKREAVPPKPNDPKTVVAASETNTTDKLKDNNPKTFNNSGPFSTAVDPNARTNMGPSGKNDILLNPEKFDPSGDRLTPKGINMASFKGDPNQLMTKNPAPAGMQQMQAQNSLPPMPKLPEPSQPSAYVNAFTPPPPPVDMKVNAFSNMNPQSNQNAMAPSYPPVPSMMAQGVPQPPMMSPPAHQVAQVNYPQSNPSSQAPMRQQPLNPAMDRRQAPETISSSGSSPSQEVGQVIQVMRESPYPAQREWAANTLGTYDLKAHPAVIQVLLMTAQQDPAPTVRAACVYSLGRMKAGGESVLATLNSLRNDGDAQVRQEVEQAILRLNSNR